MRDWCRWCRPSLLVPLLVLLALAGMVGACGTVQSDVRERSIAELEVAGLAAVAVDGVSYRNVTLSGPDELEGEAVEPVESLQATREVSYVATGASEPAAPDTTTDDTSSTPEVTADPTIGVTAAVTDGAVTLGGEVPDETTRTLLVTAAADAYGVSGPAPGLSQGLVSLGETVLTVTGTAATPEGVSTISDALAGLTSVSVSASVGADPGQAVDALGDLLTLEPITFESGSDVITAESEDTLLTAVEYLTAAFAEDPDLAVEIDGHTDDQGDEGFNQELSQARASAVLQFLTDNGVPATGLTATGYGESEPVADNATSEGRAQNRRIEFTIVEG